MLGIMRSRIITSNPESPTTGEIVERSHPMTARLTYIGHGSREGFSPIVDTDASASHSRQKCFKDLLRHSQNKFRLKPPYARHTFCDIGLSSAMRTSTTRSEEAWV